MVTIVTVFFIQKALRLQVAAFREADPAGE